MHQRIGKYHVIRAAGSGGFGMVYEGYDVELDRNVAIKICTGGEHQVERFRREARIVSQLKHRNIALVFDFGFDQEAGVHFLVEEFLSGVDLDRKIEERDRLPPALRLRYMIGIAQGLEFVHERGLIHRDLSPRNIRVLHDHTIKIMDFGLAKDVTDSTLTMIGDNFGTVGYTAPEQITGMRTVDHRTDIFSFGVIAYELLTLSNPFMATNMGTFIHKIHHHDPRPLQELWPDCPADLAEAIHRCIVKTPEDRFSSCAEILPILKKGLKYLRQHDVPVPFAPSPDPEDQFDEILDTLGDAPGGRVVAEGAIGWGQAVAEPTTPGPVIGGPAIQMASGSDFDEMTLDPSQRISVMPTSAETREQRVDSAKLTAHLPGPSGDSTHLLFDTPMPLAPVTKPVDSEQFAQNEATRAAEVAQEQNHRLGWRIVGALVAVGLVVGIIAAMAFTAPRSDSEIVAPGTSEAGTKETGAHKTKLAEAESDKTESDKTESDKTESDKTESATAETAETVTFELSPRFLGTADQPSIQLLAAVPRDLEGWNHCYILRKPQWSYGPKIRRDDCIGELFRHVDKIDVRMGERYTYQVILANVAGHGLAQSSSSVVATQAP